MPRKIKNNAILGLLFIVRMYLDEDYIKICMNFRIILNYLKKNAIKLKLTMIIEYNNIISLVLSNIYIIYF